MTRRKFAAPSPIEPDVLRALDRRVGAERARLRLALERDHEAEVLGQGLQWGHVEDWRPARVILRTVLQMSGLYRRARRNADRVLVRQHHAWFAALPAAFENFTILHISDLHVDLSAGAMQHLVGMVGGLSYDLCVLTGDYRGDTYGPFAESMDGVARLRAELRGPIYAVLGNHDTLQMVPALETMGIRMLMNECETIDRGEARIHLAGIDDAHFYAAGDIATAMSEVAEGEFSVLLSHTPEVYHEAAQAGVDLMLSGHTHGGQLCLPGSIPITLEAPALPRTMGAGAWQHAGLTGYTSVGVGTSLLPVRLNCPAEVTLHVLHRGEGRDRLAPHLA
jgi:predicted MPP superfamily phosphohydrolase